MSVWEVRLFGGLRAERGGETVTRFRSQKHGALLAYLALNPQRLHTREELVARFWPDADPDLGRNSLRTALACLRRQFEPPGTPDDGFLMTPDRTHIGLRAEAVRTDVRRFEIALAAAERAESPDERLENLRQATELYGGPLLPGVYDDWALTERDRLADAYLGALRECVRLCERQGRLPEALALARQAVTASPLREEAHADVIRLLMAGGSAAAAQRQYDELARLLDENLGDAPSPETRALLTRVGSASAATPEVARPAVSAASATFSTSSASSNPAGAAVIAPAPPLPAAVSPAPPPPLRLPFTLTRFFGREDELREVGDLLTGQGPRLVTVTGFGGSGKTRFAVEAARVCAPAFPGGVYFVPLAEVRDEERFAEAVASALSLPRTPAFRPLEQVKMALAHAGQPALLVLDSFEELAEAGGVAGVQDLLESAAGLSCLVTSRNVLLLAGEREFPLTPLATPSLPGSPERMLEFASVQLFADRARLARADFQLTAHNAGTVAQLCARLEGIPLALELAAAWSTTLPPQALLERLDHRFDLLVSRRRDVPSRHRTLRAAIEWSVRQLPEETQRFFARLSVFMGGWTLESAEAVTGDARTLEHLANLRDRSLIVADDAEDSARLPLGEADASPRFRMLETLREFARDETAAAEADQGVLVRRHRDHFLALAEEAEPRLRGEGQAVWLSRLERDYANLRGALAWSLEQAPADADATEAALRFGTALTWFWVIRGRQREGLGWVLRALDAAGSDAPDVLQARALQGAGWLAWSIYDAESRAEAVRLSGLGLEAHRRGGDRRGAAFCLVTLALAAHHNNDVTGAAALLEEAVSLARGAGDPWLLGHCLANQGRILFRSGETARARALLDESLILLRGVGDRHSAGDVLRSLANILRATGEVARAESLMEECIRYFHEVGDASALGPATLVLGFMAFDRKAYADARRHFDTALRLYREVGNRFGMAHAVYNRAFVFLEEGDLPAAESDLRQCLALFRDLNYHGDIAFALEGFASLAARRQEWRRTLTLLAAADALRAAAGVPLPEAHRARWTQDRDAAASGLGASETETAWEEGRALPVSGAFALAESGAQPASASRRSPG